MVLLFLNQEIFFISSEIFMLLIRFLTLFLVLVNIFDLIIGIFYLIHFKIDSAISNSNIRKILIIPLFNKLYLSTFFLILLFLYQSY